MSGIYSVDELASLTKQSLSTFRSDEPSYIARLIMKLHDFGATHVKVTSKKDSLTIEGDCEFPVDEFSHFKIADPSALGYYSPLLQDFSSVEVSSSTLEQKIVFDELSDPKPQDYVPTDVAQTTFCLKRNQDSDVKARRQNESSYAKNKFALSDIKVDFNGKPINANDKGIASIDFDENGFSGKVIVSKYASGQDHIHESGFLIRSRGYMPKLDFIVYEHPLDSNFSKNDIVEDEKYETYLSVRKQVADRVLTDLVQSYENSDEKDSLRDIFGSILAEVDLQDLNGNFIEAIKAVPLFQDKLTEEYHTFAQLIESDDVYVDSDSYSKLMRSGIAVSELDARILQKLGKSVKQPNENKLYVRLSEMYELPNQSFAARVSGILRGRFKKTTGETPPPEQSALFDGYLADYGIQLRTQSSVNGDLTPVDRGVGVFHDGSSYVLDASNQGVTRYIAERNSDRNTAMPILAAIFEDHFSISRNRRVGDKTKDRRALVNYALGGYLQCKN